MGIRVEERAGALVITIRAQPGARRQGIVGAHGDALKIAVTQPPEKGKANDAILTALCKTLGLRRSQIELVSGATSRQKRVAIRGVSAAELRQRIEAALAEPSG